jgi:hypothetical protein
MLAPLLPLLLLLGYGSNHSTARLNQRGPEGDTGTLEKMIVAHGSVAMDLDLNRLNGVDSRSPISTLRFAVVPDSFFTVLVFNGELRGPMPSTMALVPQTDIALPETLNASYQKLVVESTPWGEPFELVIRDGKTGFVFFNIEAPEFDYQPKNHSLSIRAGRLLLSKEFAADLGRPSDSGLIVGNFSVSATMRTIEITRMVNGEVTSDILPARAGNQPAAGTVPGPDVIVGDLNGLSQPDSAASGTQVGISVGTDSCNAGTVDLDWFALPNNDHPVIPQNLYRMSGGITNDERFEQIGQSNVKHAFTALTQNICGFGCNGVGSTHLGSGCSDPYSVSLNSGGSGHTLGSRAWINPFTGAFPRGDSATPPNSHTGHAHNSVSHRMLVEINDLNTTLNAGATYYAEAQYITPHEYTWCQANPGQCNMYNNVSHRKYNVIGTGSPFSFSTGGSVTVREKAAIVEWTGSSSSEVKPDPANDGIALVAYKVTNPLPGVWHYEYAIYNQNLDRGIQSFSVPVGNGVTLTNIGFHAPPQQPGWTGDGTVGNAGYSSAPWTVTQGGGAITWSSETFAQNQNANAIRWGTLYNFRFDANRPPTSAQTNANTIASPTVSATLGFFKTGSPITVPVQGPSSPTAANGIITGRIADQNGAPVSGVVVSLSGSQNRKIITDSNGNYRFDAVETSGFYAITPSLTDYRFTPATRSFSQLGNNTNALFTATRDEVVSDNPIDSPEYFVRQHYLDFLGREPDEAGFNFWSDQILSCGADAECIERRTINVSAAYFLSIEFAHTGGFVDSLYRASYGRKPLFNEFMPDVAVVGQSIVVGDGDWAGRLAANKQAFIAAWMQRSAFRTAYDGLANSTYVDTLISHTHGFNGDRDALVGGLNDGSLSRAAVLRSIVENEGFVNTKRNEMFVMMEYFGYLRRDPDDSGYQFWLNKLNRFDGNFERADMVKAFLVSGEYRERFRQ